jgi:hypothetical protein
MTILDVWLCVWISLVAAALYIGLPRVVQRLSGARRQCTLPGLAAAFVLAGAAGTTALAAVGLLTALSVAALHVAVAVAAVWWSHRSLLEAGEHILCGVLSPSRRQAHPTQPASHTAAVTNLRLAALGMLASMLLVTRVLPSLAEARLFDPRAYEHLHVVRRLLAGGFKGDVAPLVDAWMAALSLLSTVDAATVVRFLPPLLACALTAALIRTVWQWAGRFDVALVAGVCAVLASSGLAADSPWNAMLTRQHAAAGEYVVALLFLLGPGKRRLELTAAAWFVIAAAVPLSTFPFALALACAVLYRAVHSPVRLPETRTASAWGLLMLATGLGAIPPRLVSEPDVVARQGLRILREDRPAVVVRRAMPLLDGHGSIRLDAPGAFAGADAERWTYVFVDKGTADAALLAAAERAVGVTPGARIYHDDDELRVYELPPADGVDARHGRVGAAR